MNGGGRLSHGSKYECLMFDMDDTLYPMSSGLNLACRKNIQEYMLQHLQIEESEVPRMCLELYKEYGTTMAGLKAMGYEFDDDEFHAYVHGRLPYEDSLKPDPLLRNLLLSMPQRKIIFTNADKDHAAKVLKGLGLEDCFQGIICFETLNPPLPPLPLHLQSQDHDDHLGGDHGIGGGANEEEKDLDDDGALLFRKEKSESHHHHQSSTSSGSATTTASSSPSPSSSPSTTEFIPPPNSYSSSSRMILCKPSPEAFEAAIRIADVDPKKTIFFDDSVRNIASGKAAGLHTVIVGSSELVAGADLALSSIHNIKEALPEIWEGDQGGGGGGGGGGEGGHHHDQLDRIHQSTAVEAFGLA